MIKALVSFSVIQALVVYDSNPVLMFVKTMCLFLQKQRIYLHVFPSGKLYAGQSDDYETRVKDYKRHRGSNPHITRAPR